MRNERWQETQTSAVDRHVGRRLQALRVSRRHSILQLAELMGLPEFDLARIEKGTRRLSMPELWTLARIYGVETRFFFRAERPGEDDFGSHKAWNGPSGR